MYVYQGNGFEGSTIVGFGVSLNVTDDKATVEYNDAIGDYYETLKTGQISGRINAVALSEEQLAWLEDQKTWVKHQIEDSE